MQTNQLPGQAPAAARNLKLYRVTEEFGNDWVLLEVDLDKLTAERAGLITDFWSESNAFIELEQGDAVRAVVRLFGMWMISTMINQGGAGFGPNTISPDGDPHPGQLWSADMHDQEGWGGHDNGDPYGWCGIRCIGASVAPINYDSVTLAEVGA